jgi:hypothetical protein
MLTATCNAAGSDEFPYRIWWVAQIPSPAFFVLWLSARLNTPTP